MKVLIWAEGVREQRLAGRTVRSFAAAGLEPEITCDASLLHGTILLAKAGAWLRSAAMPQAGRAGDGPARAGLAMPAPQTNLIALGSDGSSAWSALLRRCGGDFAKLRRTWRKRRLPPVPVCFLSDAAPLRSLMENGRTLHEALEQLVFSGSFRVVRLPSLDASWSRELRVLQVVTSIQIGGAERVTLDLASELNRMGIATAVAALGHAGRTALPEPPFFVNLAASPNTPEARAARVHSAALAWGADLVHAHLIHDADARAIKARGLPLVMTIHNSRPGWPAGMEHTAEQSADLLLACAQCVEAEIAPLTRVPVRTVWNGIAPSQFEYKPEHSTAANALCATLGISRRDNQVLLVLANPRPQKRMDRLPALLAQPQLAHVHLLIAGEAHAARTDEVDALQSAFAAAGVSDRVHWLGARRDVPVLFNAADVLLSLSDWEGLSLAYLEALAYGIPVVATDAGGTREIAQRHPGLTLVPRDAGPEEIAAALVEPLAHPWAEELPKCFTRYHMARRAARFYPRILTPPAPRAEKPRLWLITNNFSTGGAQSSARRLLTALAAQGIEVRAAVVQENPARPTPGRRALIAAGIPVTAVPPPEVCDAADACTLLLDALDTHPPHAVVFWNLITSFKLHLADLLLHTPLYDVSPGAMFYSSLEKYFAAPRPELTCTTGRDYGARLTGMVVKYAREAPQAAAFLGAPVTVIPNGLPIPPLPPRVGKRDQRLTIVTAARLSPDKCLHELFAALRLAAPQLPPWRLRIAGGGERDHPRCARELRRMARGLPVEWCGALPDTRHFLAAADLFVMISEPAGCPNASLEALAAGLPVIATDVGGASEQVLDGETGLLCPPADAPALAAAIVRLARDAPLRTQLATRGRAHVEAHFSIARMAADYRRLFFPEH